ncbi:hypothetical protein PHYSODRAFT_332574 [Phytophthora sojae]|uniref:Uncharacterized protein n=1 Tax=Phytophthora sojae (strain P6497) TaxID=1094619 RepID=G4ZJH3_PHYSP|nr:hypothetical protein PHYSODRAFT_332574 [Phytophthora sojae]EGZ18838.1 hypothetical protein PHYSODRAFT_332574 [Phytophthora sojae]|eukprot:XP_009527896.1 hypothetical protein PHYSODRAFT_332574 [Phytophthora sojae]
MRLRGPADEVTEAARRGFGWLHPTLSASLTSLRLVSLEFSRSFGRRVVDKQAGGNALAAVSTLYCGLFCIERRRWRLADAVRLTVGALMQQKVAVIARDRRVPSARRIEFNPALNSTSSNDFAIIIAVVGIGLQAPGSAPPTVDIQWSTVDLRLRRLTPVLGGCTGGSFYAALMLSSTARSFKRQSAEPISPRHVCKLVGVDIFGIVHALKLLLE